jgi:hypothetical protein
VKSEAGKLSKSQRKAEAREVRNQTKERTRRLITLFLVVGLACLVFLPLGVLAGYLSITSQLHQLAQVKQTAVASPRPKPDNFTPDLGHLVMLSPGQLEGTDIAAMNLACAEGLPGNEKLNVTEALQKLDLWATYVRVETERNFHRFKENPADYFNSESYWRAAMMITILQQDFGVHYNLERMQDMSMTHGEDVFIPGLLGDLREGTCSSMPVFYIAIGRRLGYPMYLVAAKGHYFARWESKDGKVRFNMEATAKGLTCHPDKFYQGWPYKLTQAELNSGVYLRSLTSTEEMAAFLDLRGNVLDALQNRMPEADLAYAEAHALIPNNPMHLGWLILAGGKEDMMSKKLLNPHDYRNPFRDKIPPPYTMIPPLDDSQKYVIHDETAK